MKCPSCLNNGNKVLYAGIPVKLCSNEQCNTVWGFWSFIMDVLPFNGYFTMYEGNYFTALYFWLRGDNDENEDI